MPDSKLKVSYPFWYGGASSMAACFVTHPLDLAKVRLQTAPEPGQSLLTTVLQIIRTDGFLKIYSGLTASLLRQATYSTVRFGAYECMKESYQEKFSRMPTTLSLLPMSMISGALGGFVGNPSDVVNIRMQNDATFPIAERRNYRNVFEGIFRIARYEGITTLFRGISPNLVRGVLMTASQVVSYDMSKNLMVSTFNLDPSKKSTHFCASLFAGLVATTVCSPADVVKTRIMNSKGESGEALSILRNAVQKEGPAFMFRGWLPSFIRLGPHTIVTFLVLEQLRKYKVAMFRESS